MGFVVALPVLWAAALWLVWRTRVLRAACLMGGLAAALPLALPGRPPDAERLRSAYVASLRRYVGVSYVLGGETRRGTDCSGLIRMGMMDACVDSGLAKLNGRLIRAAADEWRHDCSARELMAGHGGRTRLLFRARSINAIDPARLQPGDVAVTASGIHTLAYLGDREWIEADPEQGGVVIVRVPDRNPWFEQPVAIVRWRLLDGR